MYKSRVSMTTKANNPLHQEDHSASIPLLCSSFIQCLYFYIHLPSGPWSTIIKNAK